MSEKMDIEKKKVRTPEFRVSYPNLFHPRKGKDGSVGKYSITMLFDKKKTDFTEMKRALKNAAIEKWGSDQKKWPKKLDLNKAFRDGEEKEDAEGYGKKVIFVNATRQKDRPGVINKDKTKLEEDDEPGIYPGCYAQAMLLGRAYDVDGNIGVSFVLQSVRKLREGERIGGGRDAADEDWGEDEDDDEVDTKKASNKDDADEEDEEYDFG